MAAGTKGDRVKVWLSAPLSPPHHLSPRFLSIPPFLLFYPFPPYSHFLSLLSLSFLLLAPFLGSSLFFIFFFSSSLASFSPHSFWFLLFQPPLPLSSSAFSIIFSSSSSPVLHTVLLVLGPCSGPPRWQWNQPTRPDQTLFRTGLTSTQAAPHGEQVSTLICFKRCAMGCLNHLWACVCFGWWRYHSQYWRIYCGLLQ